MDKKTLSPYVRRFLVILISTSMILLAINEIIFLMLNENIDRAPMRVELLIPEGTAQKVAAGEEVASIPNEMIFILGDELVVINQDIVSHELGPVFVPPGSSASLILDEADQYALSCSFRPSKYLGLTIKEPTNWFTRIQGLLFAVPPTVVVVFLYSMAFKPVIPAENEDDQVEATGEPDEGK